MTAPQDHHYLPVFYQQSWTGPDGKIVRYHRPHLKVVASPITPKHTGYERGLYTMPGVPPGREQQIETDFMTPHVDTPGSEAYRVLLDEAPERLTPELRKSWTLFLMAMSMRDPYSLAEMQTLALGIFKDNLKSIQDEYEKTRGPADPVDTYEYIQQNEPHVLDNIIKAYLPGLIDNEKIGAHIINMNWSTLNLAVAGLTLLTGDRPYIRTHNLRHPDCTLILPLSPTLLFLATNSQEQTKSIHSHSAKQVVADTNNGIACRAIKNVYGSTDRHLRFVENRLGRKTLPIPEWK